MEIGKAETLKEGKEIVIWALGDMIPTAEKAAAILAGRGLSAGVVNARFVRPLDEELLRTHCAGARVIATIENGVAEGGFGSAVTEWLTQNNFGGRVLRFGWPNRFVPHGSMKDLTERFGLGASAIAASIAKAME